MHTIHPLIKELKVAVIEDQLQDAIISAYAIRKIGTIEGKELAVITDALTADVRDYFKGFRLQEIVQAIQDGAKGLYEREGDMNTVSLELMLKWIRRYAESVRKEALYKQRVHEERQDDLKVEQKRIEGERHLKNEIERIYAEFLKNVPLKESCGIEFPIALLAVYYQFLDRLKLIELTNQIKNRLFTQASDEIAKEVPKRDEKKLFELFHRTKEAQIKDLARYYALQAQFELWEMEGKETIF